MNAYRDSDYSAHYSNENFWQKIATYAFAAGKQLIEEALVLYYVWSDPEVPEWTWAAITCALGYFISPLDAIPDIIPVVGYSDDASVIAAVALLVKSWTKEEHRQRARATIRNIFGDYATYP